MYDRREATDTHRPIKEMGSKEVPHKKRWVVPPALPDAGVIPRGVNPPDAKTSLNMQSMPEIDWKLIVADNFRVADLLIYNVDILF